MEHIKRTITTLEFVSGAKSVRSKPLLQLQYNEYKVGIILIVTTLYYNFLLNVFFFIVEGKQMRW